MRDRVFYELHKHEDFSHAIISDITTTPYLPCNNNITRKELYDLYYMLVRNFEKTGYKYGIYILTIIVQHNQLNLSRLQYNGSVRKNVVYKRIKDELKGQSPRRGDDIILKSP